MSEDQRPVEAIAEAEDAPKRDQLLEDYERTFDTAWGKRVFWDLQTRCHLFSSTFTPDALRSAFIEGERNIGLYLLAMTEMATEEGLKRLQAMRPVEIEAAEEKEE